MKEMNAFETIERLARESQTRKILALINESKDLEEAKEKVKTLLPEK